MLRNIQKVCLVMDCSTCNSSLCWFTLLLPLSSCPPSPSSLPLILLPPSQSHFYLFSCIIYFFAFSPSHLFFPFPSPLLSSILPSSFFLLSSLPPHPPPPPFLSGQHKKLVFVSLSPTFLLPAKWVFIVHLPPPFYAHTQGIACYLKEQWSDKECETRGVVIGYDARHNSLR